MDYKEKGELKNARQTLHQGLKSVPQFIQADFLLGYLYQQEDIFDSALTYYQKVIKQAPVKQDVLYNLENLFLEEPYRSPQKTMAFAYYNMGLIWIKKGKLDKAQDFFIQAINLKDDFASAYSNLGNIHQIRGEFDKAIGNFKKAIQYDPQNPIYYYNLGISLEAIGETQKAIRTFKKALSLNPDFREAKEKLNQLER